MFAPVLMVVIAFTFATAVFHTLLGVERRIWRLAVATHAARGVADDEIRFAHRMLKHLSGWLPASNGVVVLIGFPGLVWQSAGMSWSLPSLTVLGFWFAGQIWILSAGRIAQLVRALRVGDSEGDIGLLVPVLRGLILQHFNGLWHAGGTLLLQIFLIVRPGF
jgi:hypothetical protein